MRQLLIIFKSKYLKFRVKNFHCKRIEMVMVELDTLSICVQMGVKLYRENFVICFPNYQINFWMRIKILIR